MMIYFTISPNSISQYIEASFSLTTLVFYWRRIKEEKADSMNIAQYQVLLLYMFCSSDVATHDLECSPVGFNLFF